MVKPMKAECFNRKHSVTLAVCLALLTVTGVANSAVVDNSTSDVIVLGVGASTGVNHPGVIIGTNAYGDSYYGVAIGTDVRNTAKGGVALGSSSKATASNSIALGRSSVADRNGNVQGYMFLPSAVEDASSYYWHSANEAGALSLGFGASTDSDGNVIPGYARQITNVAAGSQDGDAVNLAQLKNLQSYGDQTYLTQDAAGNTYLSKTDAGNTYATKNSLNGYLTTSNASNTYLSKTDAGNTYATKTSLNSYLTTSSAQSTYATQANLKTTSDALNSYKTSNDTKVGQLQTNLSQLSSTVESISGEGLGQLQASISELKELQENLKNGLFTITTTSPNQTPLTITTLNEEEGDSSVSVPEEVPPGETPSTSSQETLSAGKQLNFAGDSNIKTSLSKDEAGNVTVNVAMAEDATVNSLTANEITTGNLTVNQKLTANEIEAKTVTAETVTGADIVATNSLTAPSITFANGPTLSYNNETGRLQYVSNATAAAEGEGAVATNLATTKDGIKFGANEGESVLVNLEDNQVDIKGGDEFISTSIVSNGNGGATIEVKTTDALRLALGNGNLDNGITIGARDGYQEIRIQQGDVNMGGNRIQNIGDGVAPTDAVNKRQLDNATNSLRKTIHDVDKDLRAGVAMAMAVAGLPQAYMPGKSILGVSAGTYHGQGGFAVGLSHATENRAWVIKGAATVDTRGNFGGTIGAGYQF